jgi:hypothetical protein
MIGVLKTDTKKVSISEEGQSFSQLLDVMHCRLRAAPVRMENVALVLGLGRKYDVAKAQDLCDQFLSPRLRKMKLDGCLSKVYDWAVRYELPATLLRCRMFLETKDNFQMLSTGCDSYLFADSCVIAHPLLLHNMLGTDDKYHEHLLLVGVNKPAS